VPELHSCSILRAMLSHEWYNSTVTKAIFSTFSKTMSIIQLCLDTTTGAVVAVIKSMNGTQSRFGSNALEWHKNEDTSTSWSASIFMCIALQHIPEHKRLVALQESCARVLPSLMESCHRT
jgi:hypothetical protein